MPHEHAEPVAVAIFAKAPLEGFAKTRLIPRLGAKGAADLQHQLIERTVRTALDADVGPVSLWCSSTKDHPSFMELGARYALSLFDQVDGDLGVRMQHTFAVHTATMPTLLVGTDCAVITPRHFMRCAELLCRKTEAVFIPVDDGGYILIGLRRVVPRLFQFIPWGTSRVMAETRKAAGAAGVTMAEEPPLWDIDRPEDYERALQCGAL